MFWLFRFENFTAQISLRDKENKESTMKTEKAESYYQRCSRQRT
jgi:hypothetical protein